METEQREQLDDYYRDAASWADDRLLTREKHTRLAWIIAGIAAFIAIAEAIALVMLMPLKTVVPYTFMVDKQTGYVQALKPLEGENITPDNALTQSFLVQYVIARESFDYSTVKTDYQKVASWTGGSARNAYISNMQASNAESPFALYRKGTVISARVKSVSPLSKETALVRFDTVQTDANGRIGPAQPWIATISYRYKGEPASVAERYINPLGFSVTRYRRDPEALPPVAPVQSPDPVLANTPASADTTLTTKSIQP